MRAYTQLRTLIERLGGKVRHLKQGYQYGAWEVFFEGNTKIVEGTGAQLLPEFDQFYIPTCLEPKTWNDYGDLVENAEQLVLQWLRSDQP